MKQNETWQKALVSPRATLRDAATNLNKSSLRIVLVVSEDNSLLGTLSDGDIRRGLLHAFSLDSQVSEIMNRKPIVAAEHHHSDFVLKLMNEHKVYQIPVVDAKNHLIGLHIWDTFSSISRRESRTIIMAGGKGIRLRPETLTCPKPMLEIAHKPILQHIIERIRNDGFYKISIAINYMGDMIEEFFEW